MKFNKKLIEKLKYGKIALDAELNAQYVSEILEETGLPLNNDFAYRYYYRNAFGRIVNNYNPCDLPVIPVSDFLLPEPRFKIGNRVLTAPHVSPYEEGSITSSLYDNEEGWHYAINGSKVYHCERNLSLTEDPESELIVGQEYEFSDPIEKGWVKGKLLAVIDDKYKYIARVGSDKEMSGWQQIREIQPKEVTIERFVTITKSGEQMGTYLFEDEAKRFLPDGWRIVKLTDKITI